MDAYHKLLSIPPEEQPPNLYRLLGVSLFEPDDEVLSNGAQRQYQYVKTAALTHPAESQQILNEIMAAKLRLLDPLRRREYDRRLREQLDSSSTPKPAGRPTTGRAKPAELLMDSDPAESLGNDLSAESWLIEPPARHAGSPADAEWIVGSGPEAQIRVRAQWVSRRHCRIHRADGKAFVEDLGSTNGTYVNDIRVEQAVRIHDDDVVSLGRKTWIPWPLPSDCPGRDLRVYSIGRSADCDYVIADKSVSQFHAQLLVEGPTVTLQDLNSLNGTRVGRPDRKISRHDLQGHLSVFFGAVKVYAHELIEMTRQD